MPPPQAVSFRCDTCGRQYQHSSHLRRHEATHSDPQRFPCVHCGKQFRRRDVLRKHHYSCPKNNNPGDVPPPARRGMKPRACDRCFRSKVSCNGSAPCARCASRQVTCTYTRVHVDDTSLPTSTAPATAAQSPDSDKTKIPVSFLLSFTNPEAGSMYEVFLNEPYPNEDAGGVEFQAEQQPPDTGLGHDGMIGEVSFFPMFFNQLFAEPFPDLSSSFPSTDTTTTNIIITTPPPFSETLDPAFAPLISDLESLHHTLVTSATSTYDGTFDSALAKQVFTLSNREAFVAAYFCHTHRELPFVHRPSFAADTCAPALLLAVCLCGAQYCAPRDSVLAVPRFFRIADEYVFRVLEAQVVRYEERRRRIGSTSGRGGGSEDEREREEERELYDTLRGALLIHGLLFMINDTPARKRNLLVRRPALVDAVRRVGFTSARQTQEGGEMPDWSVFVRDETRIRIAMWTILADWQQTGLFHIPGLMTVHEMTGDMPCSTELWEARDAAEFEALVAAKGKGCWRRSASLRDCMDALMAESWSGMCRFPLKDLSPMDLHILTFAFHSIIGTARFMSLLQTSIPALRRATDRWQELWRAVTAQLDAEQLRMSGIVRHSGEFCWLAKAFLEQALAGKDRTTPYFQRIGHDTPKELHEMLQELRGAQ
ncbi:uncharacterized protein B0T15DRAFT_544421 [Chaetomium strumarium]|uniref:Transcription factor n=1 Tax=Chaetomium strumarium TaxID=1170767 RepID=A0AAJ0LXU9_9PEZI|nr:hypothetical protein B0T15DRAFT_544421 [Chaetomium strumarium]